MDNAFALTPLDGRNRHKLENLSRYFSDFVLNKYRFTIELRYLEKLAEYKVVREFLKKERVIIKDLSDSFSIFDYREIQKIEKKTNHDVKAVEEYVRKKLTKTSLKDIVPMVHFGLTSDDINNIAYALMTKDVIWKIIIPELVKIEKVLKEKVQEYKSIAMIGRTHGQPASGTTLGKEFLVYKKRLEGEMTLLKGHIYQAKLTGNVGNFNAHNFLFPKVNWLKFSSDFIKSLGLRPDLITTQIQPYDNYLQLFGVLLRINNILNGLCTDMWLYASLGYFIQKKIAGEVGSSALPHKINPIYFEGGEGGFGIANSLFEFYIRKLSYSRLQRDLSDNTVRRSWGIAFGYCLLSYQSITEGLSRMSPDLVKIGRDLNEHWEILSEPIQNFLRVKGYVDAYDKTKLFFRGKICGQKEVWQFIRTLDISIKDKKHLQNLTPKSYTGLAQKLVELYGR